jgi:hypothetical protein
MSRLLLVSEIIRRLQLHRQHWGHITVVASNERRVLPNHSPNHP